MVGPSRSADRFASAGGGAVGPLSALCRMLLIVWLPDAGYGRMLGIPDARHMWKVRLLAGHEVQLQFASHSART